MLLTTALLGLGLSAAPAPIHNEEESASVEWFDGRLDQAIAKAREEKKMLFVYFWRNGSDYCAKLYQETIVQPDVAKSLGEFICFSANHSTIPGAKLVERFTIQTLPTMLFLDVEGQPEDSIAGFIPERDFIKEIARIKRGENTLSDLEQKLAQVEQDTEEDYDLRFRLAGKLQELGKPDEHDKILAAIREADPKGRTPSGARAHLWEAQAAVTRPPEDSMGDGDGDGDGDGVSPASWNMEPLYVHAKRMKLPEARFDAWNAIGNFEARRGEMGTSVKAFQAAWQHVPENQAINWASGVAQFIMDSEGEWVTSKERKFVLNLARKSSDLAKALDPESEACKEVCGDQEYASFVAYKLATLGMAYRFNGKQKQGVKFMEAAVELSPSDELRERLAVYQGEI